MMLPQIYGVSVAPLGFKLPKARAHVHKKRGKAWRLCLFGQIPTGLWQHRQKRRPKGAPVAGPRGRGCYWQRLSASSSAAVKPSKENESFVTVPRAERAVSTAF